MLRLQDVRPEVKDTSQFWAQIDPLALLETTGIRNEAGVVQEISVLSWPPSGKEQWTYVSALVMPQCRHLWFDFWLPPEAFPSKTGCGDVWLTPNGGLIFVGPERRSDTGEVDIHADWMPTKRHLRRLELVQRGPGSSGDEKTALDHLLADDPV